MTDIFLNPDDRDIGRCDDCGSDEPPRERIVVSRSLDGVRNVRLAVWLCPSCRALERAS